VIETSFNLLNLNERTNKILLSIANSNLPRDPLLGNSLYVSCIPTCYCRTRSYFAASTVESADIASRWADVKKTRRCAQVTEWCSCGP